MTKAETFGGDVALPSPLQWSEVEDLSAASQLIAQSWAENKEATALMYSAEFLTWLLSVPSCLPSLAPAAMSGNSLAAMVLATPRHLAISGCASDFALMTLWTVAPEYKGRRLGLLTLCECLQHAKRAGYAGAFYFADESNKSNAVCMAAAERVGAHSALVFRVRYLLGVLRNQVVECPSQALEHASEVLVQASVTLAKHTEVTQLWSLESAIHRLQRPGSVWVVHERKPALIAGMVVPTTTGTRCLLIDDVLVNCLSEPEKNDFIRLFFSRCRNLADIVSIPVLNYTDVTPFRRFGLRQSTRMVNAYFTTWGSWKPDKLTSMCVDVL